jgi:hypothetical protein
VFPVGIGLRDPRSQKRDLGHPSVSPFNIAEGTSFVISLPTRDDKGSAVPRTFGGNVFLESVAVSIRYFLWRRLYFGVFQRACN